MQLKNYQIDTLHRLQTYLETTRLHGDTGNVQAYNAVQTERFGGSHFPPFQPLDGLEHVPYVCLRLPTGGGKTLLCAYTIDLAAKTLGAGALPLTLWMVPTTVIKNQTLETLKNPSHANHQALQKAFGNQFRVFDIADFVHIRPQDLANNACIVVSTFASLRVENTEGRRVYDHHEDLEPHFTCVPAHAPNLERADDGKIKYSFVNLLNLHRPLVLVDEAHNAKSDLSIEVLRRVNPAAVIEYTATPAKNSNIIQSVTAAQLKAEHMIKLPIVFAQHLDWQAAVTYSIQTRAQLEQTAQQDADYIRPLILFQAENKGGAVTVDVLRDFLIQQESIPAEQIAVATGEQRELDGIHLLDPNCPIRYVITVQALKEGWDCSFAYVLCSVANTRSTTAVEQLLGRILRMPYATSRSQPELNQAYAHVSQQSWPHAVSQLTDRLISMGFEQQEVETVVYTQPRLGLQVDNPEIAPMHVHLSYAPDLSKLDLAEQSRVQIQATDDGGYVLHAQNVDEVLRDKISQSLTHPKDRREWLLHSAVALRQRPEHRSPSERGETFIVPQLCLQLDDGTNVLLEKEEALDADGFDPLASYTPLTEAQFQLDETVQMFTADIERDKIKVALLDEARQLTLDGIQTDISASELVALLARNLYRDVGASHMPNGVFLGYLHKTVQDLLARGDISLPKLIRGRFVLETVIRQRLTQARHAASQTALQRVLLEDDSRLTVDLRRYGFRFPKQYPACQFYEDRLRFNKHYYPLIAHMNREEAECAQALDAHAKVKYWVRNLERQLLHAFSLPTSSDWFYPDFVAQLDDGRILVVEYKGEHLKTNDDTQEKDTIGRAWAKISGNVFLMAFKRDDAGRDVAAQVRQVLR